MDSWGSNLLAVRRELRPDKCSYIVRRVKPTKDSDWKYITEKSATATQTIRTEQEELEDLWEDMTKN